MPWLCASFGGAYANDQFLVSASPCQVPHVRILFFFAFWKLEVARLYCVFGMGGHKHVQSEPVPSQIPPLFRLDYIVPL